MNDLKAFSFYRSYYEASKELPTKEEQADFLMAICQFVFDGVEPEIHGVASAMFKLAKPNIETSVKKASAGKIGGGSNKKRSKAEANEKQNESKQEANQKQTESKGEAINDYMINDYLINDKEEVEEEKTPKKYQPILDAWNKLPVTNIRIISGKRLQMLQARIKQYSFNDVLKAIQTIHDSPFLLGDNKRKWQITFDWFVLPNNFPKVLEGNYLPKEDEPHPAESRFDKAIADNQNQKGEDILFMDIVRAYKDAKEHGETRTLQEYAEEYRQRKRGELNGISTTEGVV